MKRIILLFLSIGYCFVLPAQVSEELLIKVHTASTASLNTSNPPKAGTLAYNTTNNSLYVYNGASWEKHKNTTITYETIAIGQGNQTIATSDASKIIGFTLITNSHWLSGNSGRMVKTWMVHEDRDVIRCFLQLIEQPYIKTIDASIQINNAANTITISNYSSRYWKITNLLPQPHYSNNSSAYWLGKIIIIRKG